MGEQHDPKQLVARSYDSIAEAHAAWAGTVRTYERTRYAAELLGRLPAGAAVLELGCGTGIPTTAVLAERFDVTGVDIAARHVELARRNVPSARFIHADMAALDLPPESFDGVAAFYSIIHLPREEHAGLLRSVAGWLRPGGLLVATMGASAAPGDIEPDWLGAPMYWSHYDSATNRALVEQAGLRLLSAREETDTEDGQLVTFLWVIAEKPVVG
ncbi:MAG TPA: class I SAM-dependent methyltransferase [Roseiflexaceae bacterium]|nr:class I SAM-dependent methyltransferase [Roseiflexaceae bacterium]